MSIIAKPRDEALLLSKTLSKDVIAAVVSSLTVAPAISIIDQAIFSNASGKQTLVNSIKSSLKTMVLSPATFFRAPQFLWIWGVYSGTYIVANSCESISKHFKVEPSLPKFIGSSITNISLSLLKDGYYTRKFGTISKHPVGLGSYACYAIRDSSTILASFILPKHATQLLVDRGYDQKFSSVAAQLTVPCMMQFASTPLHLYGMDLYNNPGASGHARVMFVKREYLKTVAARIGRILPAFGIGGVVNTHLRQ